MDRARSIRGRLPRWVVGTCLAAGVVAPLASAQPAATADCAKYASTSGSDSAAGTAASPYRTAQKLADSLGAGQTGCLSGGGVFGGVRFNRGGEQHCIDVGAVPSRRLADADTAVQQRVFRDVGIGHKAACDPSARLGEPRLTQ